MMQQSRGSSQCRIDKGSAVNSESMSDPEKPAKHPRDIWKYRPEDFGEPPVFVDHMDLEIDIYDEHTRVASRLYFTTRGEPLSRLALNAKNLEIIDVSSEACRTTWEYDRAQSLLHIIFDPPLPPGTSASLCTETICRPSDHLLEGIYYDATPPGAPPQQISQCQQWGFQRIVPCIDDMAAKCTYRTTITADERYTHLITNGDVVVPRHPVGGGRDGITYSNEITPMAPYLFFVGAGTYDAFTRPFEYPDGTAFDLELLLPPGADEAKARQALDVLADAVLWIYCYTGPGRYEARELRDEIYRLAKDRDRLLLAGGDASRVEDMRLRLADLARAINPGYRYTGTVYREIAMQNSDFGGMENVGNTTITANRIIPFAEATDPGYEYMVRVKVHEFYHNLNGSEVTGKTPFELWLNEAVTVYVEEWYHAFLFGEEYSRLQTILRLLSPDGGTFFFDRGAGSMPIEPDGFNDPNELITNVTYVKAPEFVRMIETLMGKEAFVRGLDRYHTIFRHKNASRADWIRSMEEASGTSFGEMAAQWLKQTGFPTVHVSRDDAAADGEFSLLLTQESPEKGRFWEFPFIGAIVDENGRDIDERLIRVKHPVEEIAFSYAGTPAFVSLNRGGSFYGQVVYDAPDAELILQAQLDPDVVNRFMALNHLLDIQKMRLMDDGSAEIPNDLTSLYFELMHDIPLMERVGGQFLTIFESVADESHAHRYEDLHEARQRFLRAVAAQHAAEITDLYYRTSAGISDRDDFVSRIADIKKRQLKNVCLSVLCALDTEEAIALAHRQFEEAANPTDRLAAFTCIINSSDPDRLSILDRFMEDSCTHPVPWETFLSAVAGANSPDVADLLISIETSPHFHIEQANEQRALYVRFAQNKKKSLQTAEGRAFLGEALCRLARINEYSTVSALSVFGNIDRMEVEYRAPLAGVLVKLLKHTDVESTPSVYNTARRLLRGAPDAVRRYREEGGEDLSPLL
jgi:aminopeptidase N